MFKAQLTWGLYHVLPGYNPTPLSTTPTLKAYNDKFTPKTKEAKSLNWWKNRPKYIASYIRSVYGANLSIEDSANYSWLMLFGQMYKGKFSGFFTCGMNPACSGAHSNTVRQALSKVDWMVNINLFDNETGSFWCGPGMDPKKIKTEVFMLPYAS